MIYERLYLVNPYFQRVENMYGKGGKRVYKAWPLFEKKNTLGGVGIADTATIQFTNLRVALEFFCRPAAVSILMPPIFYSYIASLNRYTQKLPEVPQKLTWSQ